MTQVDPLYPTIFKMVVNTVLCHCVMVVEATELGAEGLVTLIQDLAAYIYAYYGLVMSDQLERLLRAFYVLTCLFFRFFLQTNTHNMMRMAYQPCHTPGKMLVVS